MKTVWTDHFDRTGEVPEDLPHVTGCKCKQPEVTADNPNGVFYCEEHGRRKTLRQWIKCQTEPIWFLHYRNDPPPPAAARKLLRKKQQGPGSELLAILHAPVRGLQFLQRIRLLFARKKKEKKKGCGNSCEKYAKKMNKWGVAGCRKRIEEIVDHLEAQAKEFEMPFTRRGATTIVKLAIRRAEKRELAANDEA